MIAEFAIEPRVMARWRHFQSLHDDFGVPRGRFIARFPGEWAKLVAQLAHQFTHDKTNTPLNAKRIEEHLFSEAFKRKVVPARRPYDPAKPWLTNATGLAGAQAFQAIIAETTCDNHPCVLPAGEYLKSDPPYHIETGAKILRTSEELAAYAQPLLKVSEELQLVDPNFKVLDRVSRRPVDRFLATLEEILRRRVKMPHPLRKLELHSERQPDQMPEDLRRDFEDRLGRFIPSGCAVKVFLWSAKQGGERLHPRFLLTEYGGIKYDYGLDEGGQGEQTEVTLLPDNLWKQYRQDYSPSGTAFAINPSRDIFVVQGR